MTALLSLTAAVAARAEVTGTIDPPLSPRNASYIIDARLDPASRTPAALTAPFCTTFREDRLVRGVLQPNGDMKWLVGEPAHRRRPTARRFARLSQESSRR